MQNFAQFFLKEKFNNMTKDFNFNSLSNLDGIGDSNGRLKIFQTVNLNVVKANFNFKHKKCYRK